MNSISLFFKEGGSDKVYHATIEETGEGFVVNFAYGRRGNTLATGTKTQEPVDASSAQKIFDKIVREKKAKGYTEDISGKAFSFTDREKDDTGIHCQLLNPIGEGDLERYMNDDDYFIQEKMDGERRLFSVHRERNELLSINRKGLSVGFPSIFQRLLQGQADFLVDGELIGEVYYIFDLIDFNGNDIGRLPFHDRIDFLVGNWEVISCGMKDNIKFVCPAISRGEKKDLLSDLIARNAEGIVIKNIFAPYTSGKPSSGGSQLKYKFYDTASFVVKAINDKRSVSLGLSEYPKGDLRHSGNVTIPANYEIPAVGSIVEVRYLYAFLESGSVYQPVYLGIRNDIDSGDCLISQLKYKGREETILA